ncbi:hypothetical protein Bb109J_c1981 [Bdellovibrio bacteriovorus]|uniref:DUF4884 domain-containing protein n=1 Tax=Bdellovibrio bacteriovorus TaxID=959 RepID=UPI00045BEE0E|nr:hypothetical protein EP01_06935 [Bdellovibrio bacteriovorus]BEV68561.1 hypothetical protein Bb109J_c1981 [Bdellovibrio bacteriovorus]
MKQLFVILVLLIAGCTRDPVKTSSTNNPEVPVSLLFEYEGCKVYRFIDGRPHYYTNCTEAIGTYTENCGKACVRELDANVRGSK